MSTTSTSNYFSGQSSYSADLNNVISRAVATASLPVTILQNQQSALTDQQAEIQSLGSNFVSIQSAIDGLNSSVTSNSYSASVDVPAIASAAVSSGALAGTYALDVASLGSQTNTISASGSSTVTDPTSQGISPASNFTLVVDGKNYTLSPKSQSLTSLVDAINTSTANVRATVVNVGGSANPDYRLSVQSTQYAPDTIQINDGTNDLLTSLNTGSYVTYQINGQPSTPINSTSRTLSLSTGLTATVAQTGATNITVSQTNAGISNALSSFATAYNTAVDELNKNRGQNGGALVGNSLVSQLQSSLGSIAGFSSSSSGAVSSLSAIGLTFDQNGHLQFDPSALDTATSGDIASFLGSETGGGFIQTAYSALTSLTDSTSGTITSAGNNTGSSISKLTAEIATKQTQITQLQKTLTTQMAQADAAISSLQSQVTQITDLFNAETQASKNITG